MPEMPAFCNNCGTVFGSGLVFENCSHITLKGNSAGPCPNCGGFGHIPDGVFDVTGNAIRLISGTLKTVEQLMQLSSILVNAQKERKTKEQVSEEIQKEVPDLKSFASMLPQTRNELYSFLTIILTAIGLIIACIALSNNNSISEHEIQKMINQSIQESIQRPAEKTNIAPDQRDYQIYTQKKKQGRNDLCSCGSGKKYKKCCLKYMS